MGVNTKRVRMPIIGYHNLDTNDHETHSRARNPKLRRPGLLLFIHNHVALGNEMVMWAIASHGGNRARGEKEKE